MKFGNRVSVYHEDEFLILFIPEETGNLQRKSCEATKNLATSMFVKKIGITDFYVA